MTSAHFADSMPENSHLKIRGQMFDTSTVEDMVSMKLEGIAVYRNEYHYYLSYQVFNNPFYVISNNAIALQ